MTVADDYNCRVEYISTLIKLVAAENVESIFYTAQELKDEYAIDTINQMENEKIYNNYCNKCKKE